MLHIKIIEILKINNMNSILYRCGWCGCPTEYSGKPLSSEVMPKAINIIETYGDYRTTKVNGHCCPNGDY